MASSWITTRPTRDGGKRWRVEYRLGGREAPTRYGGSFKSKRDALARQRYVDGELAAHRAPDLGSLERLEPSKAPTLTDAAKRWQASRLDVADGTRIQQRTSINRALRVLGGRRVDELTAQDVADLVVQLHGEGQAVLPAQGCAGRRNGARP